MRRFLAFLLAVALIAGVSCGGGSAGNSDSGSVPKLDNDTQRTLKTALQIGSGFEITSVDSGTQGIIITYEQVTPENQAEMMPRWLDMASVTMSFLDEPVTIIIRPTGSGATISRVVIDSRDVAALLTGEMSFETAISRIKIEQ